MSLPPILYEDDALIAFDKPSGLAVSSDRWDGRPSRSWASRAFRSYGRELANVHRLEAAASGVLLCAKTKPALDFLSGQFQSKTVDKRYLALVAILPPERALKVAAPLRAGLGGLPAEFTIDLALDEDEDQGGKMRVVNRRLGKASTTEFRLLESFGQLAWVECRPLRRAAPTRSGCTWRPWAPPSSTTSSTATRRCNSSSLRPQAPLQVAATRSAR